MLTEKTFNTGELTLNYAEEATAGQPLLLLHGATRWWRIWLPMMAQISADWHPYAFDLRGHGKSGRDGDHYHLNDYTRDITAFLRSELNEPAVLMGHSLGALTAIATAALVPEKVRAIVLLDPPLFLRNSTINQVMPHVKFWFEFVYEATTTIHTDEGMLAKVRELAQANDTEDDLIDRAQALQGIAPESVKINANSQLLGDFNVEQALKQIKCQTVLIAGDYSTGGAMRDEDIELVRTCVPTATIVQIPGASHAIPEQYPDVVLRELKRLV